MFQATQAGFGPSNGHFMDGACKSGIHASKGSICMAVSRFLKFPIQNQSAELKSYPKSLHPRAQLCIYVGGYMREQREKAKDEKSSRVPVAAAAVTVLPFSAYNAVKDQKTCCKA